MKFLLRRTVADLIDILLFVLVYLLLFLASGFSSTGGHRVFFISLTALFVFFAPVLIIKNTVGKEVLGLKYKNHPLIRFKVLVKWLFYTVLLLPSTNPLSIVISFPYYNKDLINPDLTFIFKLTAVYILCDIIVFLFSLGRIRIIDYFLNLKFIDAGYNKRTLKSLSIILSFFTLLIVADVVQYKYSLTFSDLAKRLESKISRESFPVDLVHGGGILSIHETSNWVYVPTIPLTFLYEKRLPLKTIYIYMPYEKFKSNIERKETCYNVLMYSMRNDIYSDYEPALTRLIVTSSENVFLSYKEYKYFYYFDKNLPQWGIYGGIKADSTTTHQYIKVLNNVLEGKRKRVEERYNLPFQLAIEKSRFDSIFRKNLLIEYGSLSYGANYTYGGIEILIDTSQLQLQKINFEDAKLHGVQHLNFPIKHAPEHSYFLTNFEDKNFIQDENVSQMNFIISTYSDKNL